MHNNEHVDDLSTEKEMQPLKKPNRKNNYSKCLK